MKSVWDRLGPCKVGGMETAESQRRIGLDRRSQSGDGKNGRIGDITLVIHSVGLLSG